MAEAVLLDDVSMRFVLQHQRPRSFQDALVNLFNPGEREAEEFWALRGVTFEVGHGETVGLIGQNGSGKSTILKLISRIIEPTKGKVRVNGKVSALIELGAGFHPDLTGRENIYLNGSILGLGRKQIDAIFDEIVAFSELERFIDTPVKHYSSGMYMRLGFSVATCVNPDILIIDEVLAVGDEAFQRKCLDRIFEFKRRGKTILFVSHGLQAVEALCDRAVWIHHGQIQEQAPAAKTIRRYLAHLEQYDEQTRESANAIKSGLPETGDTRLVRLQRFGAEVHSVETLSPHRTPQHTFHSGDSMVVRIRYNVAEPEGRYTFGLELRRSDGTLLHRSACPIDVALRVGPDGEGVEDLEIIGLPLLSGTYEIAPSIWSSRGPVPVQEAHRLGCQFSVWGDQDTSGLVALTYHWGLGTLDGSREVDGALVAQEVG
jgi:lipopolysaccharide transport system ATP-binding protein